MLLLFFFIVVQVRQIASQRGAHHADGSELGRLFVRDRADQLGDHAVHAAVGLEAGGDGELGLAVLPGHQVQGPDVVVQGWQETGG